MSRHIDSFPAPVAPKPKKLIVLSAPRTGTHGLYQALKVLGFKPYHMVEVFANGADHCRFMTEGLQASAEGTFAPYFADPGDGGDIDGRAEFDKWFADYDMWMVPWGYDCSLANILLPPRVQIIVEMPFFMVTEIVEAYPDAKFLLTERDPDKWAKSWLNTIGPLTLKFSQFPTNILKHFSPLSRNMGVFAGVNRRLYFKSDKNDEVAHRNLVAHYKEYIAKVKEIVPPAQLKVCRLEDGFGWDEICPYLGVPVPADTEWPSRNQPEEFFTISDKALSTDHSKLTIAASVLAPLVAVGIWYARTEGRWLPKIF
ncbi:uncharacterized protein PG986_008881 [Apiospora aurea]|uniref:P-loop containing nucleoside triphosphate hydrolase protein n=1 Tax=Apiospora aurea TaxID=335848 RepID=A0ABR1Q6D3_9PEZI